MRGDHDSCKEGSQILRRSGLESSSRGQDGPGEDVCGSESIITAVIIILIIVFTPMGILGLYDRAVKGKLVRWL